MFEDKSPGGAEEDQRVLWEDNKEAHEVMVAQREEMKQREEKERMEMLEALMGGYQVEELQELAVSAAVKNVGNASRVSFRFGACALEFVEDRVC